MIFVCHFVGIFAGRMHSDYVALDVQHTVVAQQGRSSLQDLVLANHMLELSAA